MITKRLDHLAWGLRLALQVSPALSSLWLGLLVVQGLLPAAVLWLIKAVVDALTLTLTEGAPVDTLVRSAALLAAVMLIGEMLRAGASLLGQYQSERITDEVVDRIHAHSLALDMAYYDTREYFDKLHRAQLEAQYRPAMILTALADISSAGVALLTVLLVLGAYAWWLPLVLAASGLPALLTALRMNRAMHAWRKSVTESQRRTWYYSWLITSRDAAPELRLLRIGDWLRGAYRKLRSKLRVDQLRLEMRQAMARNAAFLVMLLALAAIAVWAVRRALSGLLSLGDLALLAQALNLGQGRARGLVSASSRFYENLLFLENLDEFFSLEPRIRAPEGTPCKPTRAPPRVELAGVSFAYRDHPVLENFDLAFEPGKITAIMGPNGTGKSTIVKLLCRLYDPDAGAVLINGNNLRSYAPAELRGMIGVLFQAPLQFEDTVAENVVPPPAHVDYEVVETAIHRVGLSEWAANLDRGFDTPLGLEFGDAELSQGQWQRLALARVHAMQRPIMILDEPTAAMDSWTEASWLEQLVALRGEATVILITHRATTARIADEIVVMWNGAIKERGTHEQLLRRGGHYSRAIHAAPSVAAGGDEGDR